MADTLGSNLIKCSLFITVLGTKNPKHKMLKDSIHDEHPDL